jgi:putative chitinase
MIGIAELIACGLAPTQARLFADPMARTFERFDISTPARAAAFIAQAGHESASFTRLEESLYYTTPERIRAMWPSRVPSLAEAARLTRNPRALANRVYANRLGNGDESSGDGWRYRGRGIFQLTGRANYMAAGDALGVEYKAQPELVAEPLHACMTAGWYWASIRGNELADSAQIDALTRRINGPGMVGADDRRSRYTAALAGLAALA